MLENNRLIGAKTRVLDLASGGARYLRELAEEHTAGEIESICVDRDSVCVQMGRKLVKKEEVSNIRFFKGDIFKLRHLKRISEQLSWSPNIIIASGLFIYFNDEKVEQVLVEVFELLPINGVVIFQSYEQLNTRKLMRKTMSTSSGEEWTLYYRKPDYWRRTMNRIGFKNILITRDRWHMNNICLGRK